jgi:hypothetical protein
MEEATLTLRPPPPDRQTAVLFLRWSNR